MPKRETGLMGYVGETVVKQWLKLKYSKKQYEIIEQIIPVSISAQGGGYLDFGVRRISDNSIVAVYEVKSQDFILGKDFKLNNALDHLWNSKKVEQEFRDSNKNLYPRAKQIETNLILLVGANEDGRVKIGKENLRNVILFEQIWEEMNNKNHFDREALNRQMEDDTAKVIEILNKPSNGKKITPEFKTERLNSLNQLKSKEL